MQGDERERRIAASSGRSLEDVVSGYLDALGFKAEDL